MSTPLEDYALLSDLRTGPLVSREGSVDWLCLPRFDSPAVFSAILGDEDDGRWQICERDGEVESRSYEPATFVLETVWRSPTGRARVTDFLPPADDDGDLVRIVECVEGRVEVLHDLRIRFSYARATPWFRRLEDLPDGRARLSSLAGPDALLLTGPCLHVAEEGDDDDHGGDALDRALGAAADSAAELRGSAQLGLPLHLAARRRADHRGDGRPRSHRGGVAVARLAAAGRRREHPRHAHHVRPGRGAGHGREGAGPPGRLRGLPPGADRQRCGGPIPGRRARRGHARPGPAARPRRRRGRLFLGPAAQPAALLRGPPGQQGPRHLGDARRPAPLHPRPGDDVGRLQRGRPGRAGAQSGGRRRALGAAARRPARGDPRARLRHLHPDLRQLRGGRLPAAAAAYRLRRLRRRADARHGRRDRGGPAGAGGAGAPLPHRGRHRRAEGDEYPFLICCFWLVEQYACSGRLGDAEALMEPLVGDANDVGLLAEEYDPDSGRLAGNFPQAFSHLGLIRAADALTAARGRAGSKV